MKNTLEKIINEKTTFSKKDFVFFWKASKGNKINEGCLSQWYMSDFIIDGRRYCCAEQYMMAKKAELFNDYETYEQILKQKDPRKIKLLGRSVKNFDAIKWGQYKTQFVHEANLAKFTQNQGLRDYICQTFNKILVEASPYDKVWGIGMSKSNLDVVNPLEWKGENLLGFVLMDVREEIIKSTPEPFSMDLELNIDKDTGETAIQPIYVYNDNYIPLPQKLWNEKLREEKIYKAKGNRRISNQLYKFLEKNAPEIADKNIKEEMLEKIFTKDPNSVFKIYGNIDDDGISWRATIGNEDYYMHLAGYDSYTEVLGAAVVGQIYGIFWRNPPDTICFHPVELAKPISRKLKSFLNSNSSIWAYSHWKGFTELTEPQLINLLDKREVLVMHRKKKSISKFEIINSDESAQCRYKALYGIDSEIYYTEYFDTYSKALENGAIEFISAIYKLDENGELYYRFR